MVVVWKLPTILTFVCMAVTPNRVFLFYLNSYNYDCQ